MSHMKFLCPGSIPNNLIIYHLNSHTNTDTKCHFFLKLGASLLSICTDIICLNRRVPVFAMWIFISNHAHFSFMYISYQKKTCLHDWLVIANWETRANLNLILCLVNLQYVMFSIKFHIQPSETLAIFLIKTLDTRGIHYLHF